MRIFILLLCTERHGRELLVAPKRSEMKTYLHVEWNVWILVSSATCRLLFLLLSSMLEHALFSRVSLRFA